MVTKSMRGVDIKRICLSYTERNPSTHDALGTSHGTWPRETMIRRLGRGMTAFSDGNPLLQHPLAQLVVTRISFHCSDLFSTGTSSSGGGQSIG